MTRYRSLFDFLSVVSIAISSIRYSTPSYAAGLRQIKVDARGAKRAGSRVVYGGRVRPVMPVTSGEKLIVYVGALLGDCLF
jgi:hypothetical protein